MSQASPPKEPNYAEANREGVYANLETLPAQIGVDRAAQLGRSYTYTDARGNQRTADFTGMGDLELLQNQIAAAQQSAPQLTQLAYDVQSQYQPQFIDLARRGLQQSDPTQFALSEAFKQQALNDLNQGTNLSPEQSRNIQQATRAAQTARGNIFGAAPTAEEAFNLFSSGEALKAQRQQVAASALGLGGINSQFGSLQGAQQGASPLSSMQAKSGLSYVNPNVGGQAAQFALGKYQGDLEQYKLKSTVGDPVNRWSDIAGTVIGAAAGAFCWVAREVYGANNPKWVQFRTWMLTESPQWLFKLYTKYGERIARWLENKPKTKVLIRMWMDTIIK